MKTLITLALTLTLSTGCIISTGKYEHLARKDAALTHVILNLEQRMLRLEALTNNILEPITLDPTFMPIVLTPIEVSTNQVGPVKSDWRGWMW